MKIYSELITEKASNFKENIKTLNSLNEKINKNKKIYNNFEKKFEDFCSKKNQVKEKIKDFYLNNFQI